MLIDYCRDSQRASQFQPKRRAFVIGESAIDRYSEELRLQSLSLSPAEYTNAEVRISLNTSALERILQPFRKATDEFSVQHIGVPALTFVPLEISPHKVFPGR